MKRPAGATFLAICLGSFASGQLSRVGDQPLWPLTLPGNVLNLLAMVAAAVAGVAAVGVWRLQPWAFKALVALGVLMLGMTAYGTSVVGNESLFDVANLLVVQGIFFGLIARYVHYVVRSPAREVPSGAE